MGKNVGVFGILTYCNICGVKQRIFEKQSDQTL